MHATARQFVNSVREKYPWCFDNRTFDVLNVGALAVNWNNAAFFSNPQRVVGIDVLPGRGVQVVSPVHTYEHEPFDVVICTSMLEHDEHWQASLAAMQRLTRHLLLITCAGPGYAPHMTAENPVGLPDGTKVWLPHYKNLGTDDLSAHLDLASFREHHLEYRAANHDTFFYGYR